MKKFNLIALLIWLSTHGTLWAAQGNETIDKIPNNNQETAKMDNTNNPILVIAEKLKENKIFPSDFSPENIQDEYSLMKAIREHTKNTQVKFYDEDIGTENDADEDYVAIMRMFSKASGGTIIYEIIDSSTIKDNVKIKFKHNNKEYSWEFQQESDSLSEEFLYLVMEHSKECEAGEFINLMDDDTIMIGFVPKEISSLLYQNEFIY
ncbi:hypothetical protein SAMN05216214_1281 [Atopomonas hussainii]|uniref:Uncharacterized protein n=1 Tax=Atopomonas hussainii TaxID=1429083 RepID=A0A1H7TEW5_9GAMM|nr:hypothetical protein [Atopomonas hussainii]SEL82924.1 hypothetical protein SAMN05216214_1281 [Atopomonas hussainii]